ncbi:MAG: DUF1385 domain-containing protein [Bacteriovoracaceae bacterium]|jgi:uncharacterized protein YqhQ|nr:DUF1385 domain-containing protein [Bacteriovoracaceae bacterium]
MINIARNVKHKLILLLKQQYTSIGGQAVIEGVMMRSPNAFVVAVRKNDGSIRLRRDQWYGLSKKFPLMKKPLLRGVLMLVESMANGLVSLNYSADVVMHEELKEEALKKGKSLEEFEKEQASKQKISIATFLTIAASFAFGIGLFIFLPHFLAALVSNYFEKGWDLDSFEFHAIDGLIKGTIFLTYIGGIGLIPDIRRVFQYHGAEHKSISTFEAEQELKVENAEKFTTLHPRCGTSFLFFLLFISIVLFSGVFAVVPIGKGLPLIPRHIVAVLFKIVLVFPIAGISYELIKLAGKYSSNPLSKLISLPGMMLQKLTTREPDREQLEVALASIKAVLQLEKQYNLEQADKKILTLEEIDIKDLSEIADTNANFKEFLE